jgi:hypothetical protein
MKFMVLTRNLIGQKLKTREKCIHKVGISRSNSVTNFKKAHLFI